MFLCGGGIPPWSLKTSYSSLEELMEVSFQVTFLWFELEPPSIYFRGMIAPTSVSQQQQQRKPPPCVRALHTTVLLGSKAILFGGWYPVKSIALGDVHIWDCVTASWSGPVSVAGIPPCPRWGHTAILYGDRMVVFGGHSDSERLNDLHVLDLSSDPPRWSGAITTEGTIPAAVCHHSACLYGDRMLVFGGCSANLSATFALDLALSTPEWQEFSAIGEPPPPCAGHTAVVLANMMIVVGGETVDPGLDMRSSFRGSSIAEASMLDMTLSPAVWKRLPVNSSLSASAILQRQFLSAVIHQDTALLYLYGGTTMLSAGNFLRITKAGKSPKLTPPSGIVVLNLAQAVNFRSTLPALDRDFRRSITLSCQVRQSREEYAAQISCKFSRIAAFLTQDRVFCTMFISHLRTVAASLQANIQAKAELIRLQLVIRNVVLASCTRSSTWCSDPNKKSQNFDRLRGLIEARNASRKRYTECVQKLRTLVREKQLEENTEV